MTEEDLWEQLDQMLALTEQFRSSRNKISGFNCVNFYKLTKELGKLSLIEVIIHLEEM